MNEVQQALQEIRQKKGITPSVSGQPQNEVQRALMELRQKKQAEPQPDGFFKGLLRPFGEVATQAVNVGESIYDIARGDTAGAQEALQKKRDLPILGETKPAMTGQEGLGEATKKILGYGAEIGSYLPMGGAFKTAGVGVKTAFKEGLLQAAKKSGVQLAKEGAVGGGLALGGQAAQENKSLPEIAVETGKGVLGGGAGGLLLGGVAPLAMRATPQISKFGLSKLSGLSPHTLETAIGRGADLAQARTTGLGREAIGERVASGFAKLKENISDLGKAYEPIRTSAGKVTIPKGYWSSKMADIGITLDKDGLVDRVASRAMTKADKTAVDDFLKIYAKEGEVSANDFLKMREALSNVSQFDTAKTTVSKSAGRLMREQFNDDFRKAIPGLEELDAQYSPVRNFLKETKSVIDSKGNVKLSTVVNSLKKGREGVRETLEKLSPGITKDLELLSAIEDIEVAAGNKIGAYAQNMLFGGGVASIMTANPGPFILTILTNPKVIIPILEKYSAGKLFLKDTINKIIQKLGQGVKPTVYEGKILSQALKEAEKAPEKFIPAGLLPAEGGTTINAKQIDLPSPGILEGQAKLRDFNNPFKPVK